MTRDPYARLADRFIAHYDTVRGVVRHVLVDRQLRRHMSPPPAKILDIGGGSGYQSIPLARDGYHVTILDPSPEMLGRAETSIRDESPDTRGRIKLVDGRGESGPQCWRRRPST